MPQLATTDADRNRRLRRRGLILLLVSLSVASLGAGAFSLAIFTDSDASTGTFTAGTIDIATNPTTLFTVAAMMPGDAGSATLTVNNGGTGQLRYAMTSVSTNADTKALRDQVALTVRPGACPSVTAAIYTGPLNGAAFGSTVQGAQAGDRTLNAAASEQLCFGWSFAAQQCQHLPGRDHHDHLHVHGRADREQPVTHRLHRRPRLTPDQHDPGEPRPTGFPVGVGLLPQRGGHPWPSPVTLPHHPLDPRRRARRIDPRRPGGRDPRTPRAR